MFLTNASAWTTLQRAFVTVSQLAPKIFCVFCPLQNLGEEEEEEEEKDDDDEGEGMTWDNIKTSGEGVVSSEGRSKK